jgi:hypothetical protein
MVTFAIIYLIFKNNPIQVDVYYVNNILIYIAEIIVIIIMIHTEVVLNATASLLHQSAC